MNTHTQPVPFPLNEHGNVDLRKRLPAGFSHVSGSRLTLTCKSAGVPWAMAFIGLSKQGRFYRAEFDGVVVRTEDAPTLLAAIEKRDAKRKTPAEKWAAKEARQERDRLKFKALILAQFPAMPEREAGICAERATEIGSGAVGRSETAENPVLAAVVAYARHAHTDYEDNFAAGFDREENRRLVGKEISGILNGWKAMPSEVK